MAADDLGREHTGPTIGSARSGGREMTDEGGPRMTPTWTTPLTTLKRISGLDPAWDDKAARSAAMVAQESLPENEYNALVAGGKMVTFLFAKEHDECLLRASVYDAAIIIPQVARSTGWPKSLMHLSVLSYVYLALNCVLQLSILYMINQEEYVMDRYAGQMNLCDFGADVTSCPGGPNCAGPSGTDYANAGRMYSWKAWSTRVFMKISLKSLFPDKAHLIEAHMDPGEYGLENWWCRAVCVFIFMMSLMSDLRGTMDMVCLMWFLPPRTKPWVEYRVPRWDNKERVKEMLGLGELDFVKFKLDGMSRCWKVSNLVFIILPKFYIWLRTASIGVAFLMQTAGIEDVIVNVTALSFILNLDEIMFSLFGHRAVHDIVGKIEPYIINEAPEQQSHEDALVALWKDRRRTAVLMMFPWRPLLCLMATLLFLRQYYAEHCEASENGGQVSQAMHLPTTAQYPLVSFLVPFWPQPEAKEAYWQMPPGPA